MEQLGDRRDPDFRAEVTSLRADMHGGFDALERLIVRGGAVLLVTMVVGFLGVIIRL